MHDEHHEHAPEDPPGEPHTHAHQHKRLVHSHPHYPIYITAMLISVEPWLVPDLK